jgi:GntR family transcriptional regulator, transcriptional repressor for pyruvate dehydrogenase complex
LKYKKIKSKKIYEEVAEVLYEGIRTGQLKPGTKLDSVQQLAENFAVGRSAIREALSALKAMGLVEMKQGQGTYVKEFETEQLIFPLSTAILMNKEDVKHLLEVRKIVETGAVASAAVNRTTENLTTIEQALEEMKEANGNEELGEKSDLQFHLAIAAASQNPLLMNLLLQISDIIQETMKETRRLWLYSKETTTDQLYSEHLEVYKAVLNQDASAASEAMLAHLNNVDRILGKFFDETDRNVQG